MARQPKADTWRAQIVEAFSTLGGDAQYQSLYTELGRMRRRPLTLGERAGVRREIENCSSDSANYRQGRPNLFESVGGLRSGHWGLRERKAVHAEQVEFKEGERQLAEIVRIKRSQGLVAEARRHYGLNCAACDFNFEEFYGKIGRSFIEVHHLELVSSYGKETAVRIQDVTVLCSNCHRMAHTSNPPLTVAKLRSAIKNRLSTSD